MFNVNKYKALEYILSSPASTAFWPPTWTENGISCIFSVGFLPSVGKQSLIHICNCSIAQTRNCTQSIATNVGSNASLEGIVNSHHRLNFDPSHKAKNVALRNLGILYIFVLGGWNYRGNGTFSLRNTKFANFAALYFPYSTTFRQLCNFTNFMMLIKL